jgi:hypothetical protein
MVKLVDQGFLCVDQLVDDLHEWRDLCGVGLIVDGENPST